MTDIRVGKRSTLVIPAAVRRQLGIAEGDLLRVEVDRLGRLVLAPVAADPVERLRQAGAAVFSGVDGVAYQDSLRDEWER